MEDSGNIFAAAAGAATPRQWLTAYLRTRAHLANHESDFHCDPACTRPGCKNEDLQVPASLVDLVGAALHLEESVAATYRNHYFLGLLATERNAWIRRVSLRLKKPCPFLLGDRCGIYPVRPLACALFPEYLVYEGRFEAEAGKAPFRDFLCLRSPLELSPQRAAVIAGLKRMWQRETLISSFYLFQQGQFCIDFSNLTAELLQAERTGREAASPERPEPQGTIPHRVMEQFFQERIAPGPLLDGVRAQIDRLENQEGLGRFLQLLQDDRLMKKLRGRGDDHALIFRFAQGQLRGRRRSLLPGEYKFY